MLILREQRDGTVKCRIPYDEKQDLTTFDLTTPVRVSASSWRCKLKPHVVDWLDEQGIAYQQSTIQRRQKPSDVRILFKSVSDAMAFKMRFG